MPTTKSEPVTTYLARIYPPNRKRGYYAESYILHGSGYPKFVWHRGWYTVDAETADRMRKILNNPNDPHSRPVFQIVTRDQAEALDEVEKETPADAVAPIPLPKTVEAKRKAVEAKERAAEKADLDLRDEIPEDEWADLNSESVPEFVETADEDDLAELEALTEEMTKSPDLTSAEAQASESTPKAKPTRQAKKVTKKAKKKPAKKRTAKKRSR